MKTADLKQKLQEIGISKNEYNLDGELQDNSIILWKNHHQWQVIMYERGNQNEIGSFSSEDEACEYIYNFFLKSVQSWNEHGLRY